MEKIFLNSFKNENISKIYALGDIHGDIIPLIICLRDCCKVIKKKSNFDFKQDTLDQDLENQLNKEWNETSYVDDLNYEWIGENSKVVLCGDILDNVRGFTFKKPGEYPMEEARIFKFINSINKQAMLKGGNIYKVLGNHDMYNLNGRNKDWLYSYISKYAKNYEGYKQEVAGRTEYFLNGNPGSKLIAEDGAYLFLMIKDFIFVHGGISSSFLTMKNVSQLNESLMEYISDRNNKKFDLKSDTVENQLTFESDDDDGLVHDRFFGFKKDKSEEEVCSILYNKFTRFCKDMIEKTGDKNFCNPNKMKLVIGHCNQNKYTSDSDKIFKSSFETLVNSNKDMSGFTYSEELSGFVNNNENNSGIYGITVSCGDRDENGNYIKNKPSIFRIDVGMSRGFNKGNFNKETAYSRTPQVLKIEYINNEPKISIIKSTFENTIIHMKDWDFDPYRLKYLKYKNKYLKLKSNIT
jgi:hypothetical protein